jgi:hypothetical protein
MLAAQAALRRGRDLRARPLAEGQYSRASVPQLVAARCGLLLSNAMDPAATARHSPDVDLHDRAIRKGRLYHGRAERRMGDTDASRAVTWQAA